MKVKACPFCGATRGILEKNSRFDFWWLTCSKCGAQVTAHGKQEVLRKWDMRVEAGEAK